MFLVMVQRPNSSTWLACEFDTLSAALLAAEEAYKAGQSVEDQPKVPCVKVLDIVDCVCKAKWGPLDPGGIFNASPPESLDVRTPN